MLTLSLALYIHILINFLVHSTYKTIIFNSSFFCKLKPLLKQKLTCKGFTSLGVKYKKNLDYMPLLVLFVSLLITVREVFR